MKKIIVMLAFCLLSLSVFPQERAKKTVAVLEFEGGSGQDAITLADVFGSILANKKVFNVLTRTSVEAIMNEHKFQRLGVTDSENITAIGKLVNADYIISGKITTLGNVSLLTVQMISIVTGQLEAGVHESFKDVGDTLPYIETMVDNIVSIEKETNTIPKTAETNTVPKKEPTTKKYKIGDIGPGGGLVFFAEGGTYLECSRNLGKATWADARKLAKNYKGGGYNDWYLPSKKELNYIYENLRVPGYIKGAAFFWSSSMYNNLNVWVQDFLNGNQFYYNSKSNQGSVRVVRAF